MIATPEAELAGALRKVIVKILEEAVDSAIKEVKARTLALDADCVAALRNKEFLKAGEVEKLYNIKAATLAVWRSRRQGPPFIRCEGAILYKSADVKAYLDGCREVPAG
jgi:DNA-binding transcriptional regulator YiaG